MVPLLHFSGNSINSCIFGRLGVFFWRHTLLIELQIDGVSRECKGIMIIVFTGLVSIPCPSGHPSKTPLGFNDAIVTKLEEGSGNTEQKGHKSQAQTQYSHQNRRH